jgi:hypothetical protein
VALAQGKRLQDVAFAAAGRVLPPSPYAADALSFVQRVANGQNVQHAALSTVGQRALRQVRNQASLASYARPSATPISAAAALQLATARGAASSSRSKQAVRRHGT